MNYDTTRIPTYERADAPLPMVVESIGEVAVASTSQSPNSMFSYMAAAVQQEAAAKQQRDKVEADRVEAVKMLDKEAFKLGDLNPLIHQPDLTRRESIDAIRHTIMEKIHATDGLEPVVLESSVVFEPNSGGADLRFIARFEVPALTERQLELLEQLIGETYGVTVRTRTDSKGNDIQPENYPPVQVGEEMRSKTGGWYMGPNLTPTTSLHQGLFVFRDLGQINKKNFLTTEETTGRYIVEVREASQYQTDLVTFITQISSILKHETSPDRGQLLYESYYDLMRLGLKKAEEESIYGMDKAADMIRRELIIPLASPDISRGVGEDPQSVLMIGVPGTGKTLIVERLLQEETGLFVLPIDPFELQKELAKPKEKQYLMPRIAEVARITGRRVVLHVDDIENMVTEREVTNSTMLNLMAGVQESGFYIIASTNYPEKINPSLIQPQRFSVLIHCGLQNEQARFEILKIHAGMNSNRLDMPLFESEEIRDIILQAVATHTDGFTPRYLSNIATIAKSHLIARVASEKARTIGLTEEDLADYTFTLEDWELAYAEVAAKYDHKAVKEQDQVLLQFVQKHSRQIVGFTQGSASQRKIFPSAVLEQVTAAQARLESTT
ncbi:MAG: ATP-binding protein [Candidatus Saccharimonas sp.]